MSDRSQRYREPGREEHAQSGAGTGTRSESSSRTATRKKSLLGLVIAVCVTGVVLSLATRVTHPDRAAASTRPSATGGASPSGPANLAGALPSVATTTATPTATAAATAAATPAVLTQTVQSSDTLPGTLSLDWPDATESATALEGVGTMATHGTPDTPVPIASVTKTMTAFLVLKDHPMQPGGSGATMTVEQSEADAYSQELALNQSLVRVNAGEQLTERQALQALMLASADNVAQILGRWDAGSDTAFVAEMNKEASSLGMTDSRFTDPSGYDSGTRSSANDLIKLGEAAMAIPAFAQIVAETSAQIPVAGTVTNYNKLLGENGVDGIKTGSTSAAGGCLLFAAKHVVDGQTVTVIGVVLGAPGSNATAELKNVLSGSDELLESVEAALREFTVAPQGVSVATGPAPGSPSGSTAAVRLGPKQSFSLIAWPGLTLTLKTATASGGPVLTLAGPSGASLGTAQLTAI
ncbi:MAG TPA: hypothetical protein VGX23_19400 [Actinocrinis sp.]|nr:hypothetical protein [Actinocrinis sp.]